MNCLCSVGLRLQTVDVALCLPRRLIDVLTKPCAGNVMAPVSVAWRYTSVDANDSAFAASLTDHLRAT